MHQSSFPYFFSILRDTIFCTDSVLQENPILVVVENSSLQIAFVVSKLAFLLPTDYGHPMKPFFHSNQELLGLGRQVGQINSGTFGVFSAKLSAPILVMFSIIQPLFLQKKTKPLYPHPKYLFRIRI